MCSGKPVGDDHRCRASGMPAPIPIAMAASRASRSVVDGLDSSIAAGRKMARTAIAHAIPRWNRPASEYGQGSISRLTSRPWLDVVQVSLTGQELQTEGLAR